MPTMAKELTCCEMGSAYLRAMMKLTDFMTLTDHVPTLLIAVAGWGSTDGAASNIG